MINEQHPAPDAIFLGIDFGTSGCRAVAIDANKQVVGETSHAISDQQPERWLEGLDALFTQLGDQINLQRIQRLALDATSSSVLLSNPQGEVISPVLMYYDNSSGNQLQHIQQHCPDPQHIVHSASSSLAKALNLAQTLAADREFLVLHQADYLSNYLCGHWGHSDYHNVLKLGYDLQQLCWPQWILQLLPAAALPHVHEPGQVYARIKPELASHYGLNTDLQICAGSTDANAAFISTESTQPGDAVTSLGSTIVLKILSKKPIQDLSCGIYSHRLGTLWLAGGASNAGGAVLRLYFSDDELTRLSQQIRLEQPTGLDYYPLPTTGERFPFMDPHKAPRLTPRPDSDVVFLQAILEGLSHIEQQGYDKLQALGADPVRRIQTVGGGAANATWQALRSQCLGMPVSPARHSEAAYGSALLALQGLSNYQ